MAEEQWIPGSKTELMAAIRQEWKLLMEAVDRLSETRMTAPDDGGWSPKDNLAHLTEWLNVLMGYHMDNRPAHEVLHVNEEATRGWDMDVINPILYERNRSRPAEDVLEELKGTYEKLLEKLEAMPFEDLMKPRHPDDPKRRPLLLWVLGDSSEHFAEHRETIEKLLDS